MSLKRGAVTPIKGDSLLSSKALWQRRMANRDASGVDYSDIQLEESNGFICAAIAGSSKEDFFENPRKDDHCDDDQDRPCYKCRLCFCHGCDEITVTGRVNADR